MRGHVSNSTMFKDWDLDRISFAPKNIAPEEDVKDAKSVIKSAIMAHKGGIPVDLLRDEYKKITGEEIPYLKLGYNSLFHFLRDIPEIRNSRNEAREPVLIVEPNSKTKHLFEMIQNQKDPKTLGSKKRRSRDEHRRTVKDKSSRNRQRDQDEQRNISSSSSSSSSTVAVNENMARPFIHNVWDFESQMSVCTDPVVNKSQLIGDDYMLQLCIKYLTLPLYRKDPKSAITCGTVQSGLTIRKAINRLDKIKTMSNKLIINVGTVDIYNRRTDEEMISDYQALLTKLKSNYGYASSQITLCTLPPMANVGLFSESKKYFHHASFNSWLREYAKSENYPLLDLHDEFTNDNMIINYDLFQQNARMVSGTIHPHCLWNYFGRQKAMKLLSSV